MTLCYCCSKKDYTACCAPFILGEKTAPTPEALMRSRYTAYSLAHIAYIEKTMRGKALLGFDADRAARWAKRAVWIKLEVIDHVLAHPSKGTVTFKAFFVEGQQLLCLHEKSEFIKEADHWYYVDGLRYSEPNLTVKKELSRTGPCPCGSKRKFKSCHGQASSR